MAKRKLPPQTPLIRAALRAVRAGQLGVNVLGLTDHLEETGHPLRLRVQQVVQKWIRHIDWARRADFSRCRRWTRWETIAAWHSWLRRRLLTIFEAKRIRVIDRRKLYQLNEAEPKPRRKKRAAASDQGSQDPVPPAG